MGIGKWLEDLFYGSLVRAWRRFWSDVFSGCIEIKAMPPIADDSAPVGDGQAAAPARRVKAGTRG